MHAKKMGLVWIVVTDFKRAVHYYTEVVGLKVVEMNEQWGWAELEGHEGGGRLGIAQQQTECTDYVKPGQNAIATFDVDNLEKSIDHFLKKGANLVGKIEEVPGHVRLQTVKDPEGNYIQLVEVLNQKKETKQSKQMSGCCSH